MTAPLTHPGRRIAAASAALLLVALLAACAPEDSGATPEPGASASNDRDASAEASPDATDAGDETATPSPSASVVALPTDCKAILTAGVLAQLDGIPLNDPAFGASGPQADGSLVCIWADPGADTTGLTTTITRVYRGPALDLLNQLADAEGYTCYTPDGGTRCEKTWQNATYPVTDGRTLFWREDVLIDTRFSNLAPTGYTAAIIASVFDD